MKKWLIATALALTAAAGLAACGGDDGDEGEHTIVAAGNPTDRAFVAEMVPHHETAIEMAEMAQDRGQSEFVTSLADDIVRTQEQEIDTMRGIDTKVAAAGTEVGDLGLSESMMGMHGDVSRLEHAPSFDPMFMRMMIPHHEGAIQMARIELEQGENPQLKQLAQQIIDAQSREITEMKAQLAGVTSDESMPHGGGSMDAMGAGEESADQTMEGMGH